MSFDFAVAILPGWHATIFPPYFVAGAVFRASPWCWCWRFPSARPIDLEDMITMRHLDNCAKVMLATGMIVAYGYFSEAFFSWYGTNPYEKFVTWNRAHGPYAPIFWATIFCNVVIPQLLWLRKVRFTPILLFFVSLFVLLGMWFERFMIVVISLQRDFLPSSWGMYTPTRWDWMTFAGTIGFFLAAFLLFIRVLPMISVFEMKHLVMETTEEARLQ